jgi:hypothetical protein
VATHARYDQVFLIKLFRDHVRRSAEFKVIPQFFRNVVRHPGGHWEYTDGTRLPKIPKASRAGLPFTEETPTSIKVNEGGFEEGPIRLGHAFKIQECDGFRFALLLQAEQYLSADSLSLRRAEEALRVNLE